MRALVRLFLSHQASGSDLAFAIEEVPSGTVLGMTRFLEIDRAHERVEIGGTWLDRSAWRTPVNTEAKYLLLRHAFEVERVRRVQFKTDLRNERSQRALERIGAVREGVLRAHLVMPDGYARSSVVYSLVADEWPSVRARLAAWVGAGGAPPRPPPPVSPRERAGPAKAP